MTNTFFERVQLESEEKWTEVMKSIPALKFDSAWNVRIIPPFGGAMARFWIERDNGKRVCSVYLDWYDTLGHFGEPYYELYPWEDDIKRYALSEVDQLIEDIRTLWERNVDAEE